MIGPGDLTENIEFALRLLRRADVQHEGEGPAWVQSSFRNLDHPTRSTIKCRCGQYLVKMGLAIEKTESPDVPRYYRRFYAITAYGREIHDGTCAPLP